MKLIYTETKTQHDSRDMGTPCTRVKAFIPTFDGDEDITMPALIELYSGVMGYGESNFTHSEWFMFKEPKIVKSNVIRFAIKMFDEFTDKVFKEADDLRKASSNG